MEHASVKRSVGPKTFVYLRCGKKDTDRAKDQAPHTFCVSVLRWCVRCAKATVYGEFMAKGVEVLSLIHI